MNKNIPGLPWPGNSGDWSNLSVQQKAAVSIPGQGTYPGCGFSPRCPFFSLPKINKNISSGEDLKYMCVSQGWGSD